MIRATRQGAAAVIALGISLFASATARAQSVTACVGAFERGQELQSALKLRAAREQYLQCARESCHTMVRKDCAQRLEEVTRDLPTATFGARDAAGRDLRGARIFVDDVEIDPKQAGGAQGYDPGEHTVRVELSPYVPHSETLVLRVGEKNRAVVAVLERPAAAPLGPEPHPTAVEAPSSRRPWAYGLAGASALSIAGFAIFAVSGMTEKNHLLETCAAACSDRQIAVVDNRYLAADVLLAVGVLTGAVATYLFVTEPSKKHATVSLRGSR